MKIDTKKVRQGVGQHHKFTTTSEARRIEFMIIPELCDRIDELEKVITDYKNQVDKSGWPTAAEEFFEMCKSFGRWGVSKLMWGSFRDPEKPDGQSFLGVIITRAESTDEFIQKTHGLKINPGGEILFADIPPDMEDSCFAYLDRLLTREEANNIGSQ